MKKIFKQIVAPLSLFIIIATVGLHLAVPANAQTFLENVGKDIPLPNYQAGGHAESSYEQGASNITSAILFVVDFLKYIMGSIAVIIIIISGIRLITAAKQIDEVANKQKENLKYALIGLVVIMLADQIVKQAVYGEQGEIYGSEAELKDAAGRGTEIVESVYNTIEYFMAAIAVLMIIVAGFRLVVGGGEEDAQTKSKKQITYAVIGLMLLGVAEFAVKDIIFPKQGAVLSNVEVAKMFIVKFTNFVSGFISAIAVAMYMYGGYLYVIAFGKEDETGKAKKVFIGATVGLLIALAAFAIVSTTVELEPNLEKAGTEAPLNLPTNANPENF